MGIVKRGTDGHRAGERRVESQRRDRRSGGDPASQPARPGRQALLCAGKGPSAGWPGLQFVPKWGGPSLRQLRSPLLPSAGQPWPSAPQQAQRAWTPRKQTRRCKGQASGFPGGPDGKEPACSAGGDRGLIPGLGRSLGEGNGYHFRVFARPQLLKAMCPTACALQQEKLVQ